jgi:hypothetical protein
MQRQGHGGQHHVSPATAFVPLMGQRHVSRVVRQEKFKGRMMQSVTSKVVSGV